MHFEKGGIYHIYNQGNNRQAIFYNRENYLFFVRKIRTHVLPFADILAWCLMPNHFHLMVEVKSATIDGVTQSHPVNYQNRALPVNEGTQSHLVNNQKNQTFNNSIGVMLRSYTRAINKQENRTGALFREETKAICLNEIRGISSNWYSSFGVTFLNVQIPENQYLQICFNYIHNNPVTAHLTKTPGEWEFSSYLDIAGKREGKLVNKERIEELGLKVSEGLSIG